MAKTKYVPWDKTAKETEYGTWEWKTGGLTWWWKPGNGVNFGVKLDNDELRPLAFMKTLNDAGIFAEGYACGVANATAPKE